MEHFGDPEAVLVIHETGFLKKGDKSAGVKRPYCGTAGRVENGQIGVFLAYASAHRQAFLDRARYLPQEWADDDDRRAEAGVPEDVEFATKPELARQMLERAFEANVPAAWVTADEIYGRDWKIRHGLEEHRQPYVVAVSANQALWRLESGLGPVQRRVDQLAAELGEEAWIRLSVGDGAKGPRVYEWAGLQLPLPLAPEGWGPMAVGPSQRPGPG